MKLIVLYGPPAVGKLTVAKEIAKQLTVRIFDNRRISEAVEQVINRDNPQFVPLVYSLQIQILNAAMRYGAQDIIVTLPFTTSSQADIALLQTILEAGRAHATTVQLVHLKAKHHALLERVQQESRHAAGKLTDPQELQNLVTQYDFDSPFPDSPSITINTTHLTAPEVAQQIIRNINT